MKKLFKRLTKSPAFHALLCWLIANYIRLVHYTSRRTIDIPETAQPYIRGDKPALYAFWHGRLLLMPMLCPPMRKMHVLISTHRDGNIIARTMLHFNFGILHGSSTRGGITAGMNGVKALQAGENISITPDGPRGPAMQIQPGLITMAALAGVPIIPVTFSSSLHKRMKTWDHFMVALPFGKVCYKLGAPMENTTKEELENKMVALTEEADRECISSIAY